MRQRIRWARESDAPVLSTIAFESKGWWNYPPEWMERWKTDLTVTETMIRENLTYVMEENDVTTGFGQLVFLPSEKSYQDFSLSPGLYLDYLFVSPSRIGSKIGSGLWDAAISVGIASGFDTLRIYSDPNARGFYERKGAVFVCDAPTPVADLTAPILELALRPEDDSRMLIRKPLDGEQGYIWELWADSETMRPVGGPVRPNAEERRAWITRNLAPGSPSNHYLFITENGVPIGEVSCHRFDSATRVANFNIKVHAASRGRGYGLRAGRQFLHYFFANLRGNTLYDEIWKENEGARIVLEKLGFAKEASRGATVLYKISKETYFATLERSLSVP